MHVCVHACLARQARIRAAALIQALGVCMCVYVCVWVRVSEFLAQQARIREATLIRALGMYVCESMYVCACISVSV